MRRPNSGYVSLTDFYGYVRFKDIVFLISQPVKAENIYKGYVFTSVFTGISVKR